MLLKESSAAQYPVELKRKISVMLPQESSVEYHFVVLSVVEQRFEGPHAQDIEMNQLVPGYRIASQGMSPCCDQVATEPVEETLGTRRAVLPCHPDTRGMKRRAGMGLGMERAALSGHVDTLVTQAWRDFAQRVAHAGASVIQKEDQTCNAALEMESAALCGHADALEHKKAYGLVPCIQVTRNAFPRKLALRCYAGNLETGPRKPAEVGCAGSQLLYAQVSWSVNQGGGDIFPCDCWSPVLVESTWDQLHADTLVTAAHKQVNMDYPRTFPLASGHTAEAPMLPHQEPGHSDFSPVLGYAVGTRVLATVMENLACWLGTLKRQLRSLANPHTLCSRCNQK